MKKIKVFILAAGQGERLRPITLHTPKPLLPVLGIPIIERVLRIISTLNPERIGVNLHYKGNLIRHWIASSPYAGMISLYGENPVLGTGGALKNASDLLEHSEFLVHNADILSDIDLNKLIARHRESRNLVTLAVHDYDRFNNVWTNDQGDLISVGKEPANISDDIKPVAFTGIAVYSPEFLDYLPEGVSSVADGWLRASKDGRRVGTVDFSGCKWHDIGTPSAYASLVFDILKEQGEMVYIDPSVSCCNAEIGSMTVLEKGSNIEGNAILKNCIFLDGGKTLPGAMLSNVIVGPEYIVDIDSPENNRQTDLDIKSPFLPAAISPKDIVLIGTGGSDRRYYRIPHEGRTAVLMKCHPEDEDFRRHISLTKLLSGFDISVPALIASDSKSKSAIFSDLGDISLYSWLKCRRPESDVEVMYRLVIDNIAILHSLNIGVLGEEYSFLGERVFDFDYFRWETEYFRERFLSSRISLDARRDEALDRELDTLAGKASCFMKSLLHRDLQSQNIMMPEGVKPWLIDYQGARLGPAAYDIASLLWDPYYCLEDNLRDCLISYYIEEMKSLRGELFDEVEFRQSLLPCCLQRHMQALGAYGFLSSVKSKKYFLKHVPQALKYLKKETETARKDFPVLCGIMEEIDEKTAY